MKRRYSFNLMRRSSATMRNIDADKPIDPLVPLDFVRATEEAESDNDALRLLRERYPESAWRLVSLYEIEPVYLRIDAGEKK